MPAIELELQEINIRHNYINRPEKVWAEQGYGLSLHNGTLKKDDFWTRLFKNYLPGYEDKKRDEIFRHLYKKAKACEFSEEKKSWLECAYAILQTSHKKRYSRIACKIDWAYNRLLWQTCRHPIFHCQENKKFWLKWTDAGLNAGAFFEKFCFVEFAFASNLVSQMKITGEDFVEVEGKTAITVMGNPMTVKEFLKEMCIKKDPTHHENLLCHKASSRVFTYLKRGDGLVPHHPYHHREMGHIANLTKDELQATLQKAQLFERHADAPNTALQRTHVLQIVTSYEKSPHDAASFLGKCFRTFSDSKHAYMRLIDQEGRVYEDGFGFEEFYTLPLRNHPAHMRSPDIWNYKKIERVVTNIAITPGEFKNLKNYVEKYQLESLDFGRPLASNLGFQNCVTYIRKAVKHSTGIDVTTQSTLSELVARISPQWVLSLSLLCHKAVSILSKSRFLPLRWTAYLASLLWSRIHPLALSCLELVLGGGLGKCGIEFPDSPLEEQKDFHPPSRNIHYWLDGSKHRIDIPCVLQEWQRRQPSTVVFQPQNQLCIAPN